MPEQSSPNTHALRKAHYIFLALRSIKQHFIPMLRREPFEQQNHQEKAQRCEKHGTKESAKRTCLYSMTTVTRKQSTALLNLSWGCAHQVTQIFSHSGHVLQ